MTSESVSVSVSEQSSSSEGITLSGEFVSSDGDDAVLLLQEDGAFVNTLSAGMELANSNGDSAVLKQRTEGTYRVYGSKCLLKIRQQTLWIEGMDGSSETEIQELARLLGEDQEEIVALYVRMLRGEEISAAELYGEDFFHLITTNTVVLTLDTDHMTYQTDLPDE